MDKGVIVIATSIFYCIGLSQLFISFGVGSNPKYVSIHEIVLSLEPTKWQELSLTEKSVAKQCVVVAKKAVKEGAASGNLTLTVAHYAGTI